MSTPLIALEKEPFPNRIRWTVEECYRLANDGYLTGRYELIDGEILSKMGQNPPHRMVLILIAEWLISLFGKVCIQEQEPIHIPGEEGKYTEPEPDIAVTLQPTTVYLRQHPGPDDILLVVEVADSSLGFDLTTKALLYARAGIREYWVADIAGSCFHVHRGPGNDGYRAVYKVSDGEMLSLESRPQDETAVAAFFLPLPVEDTGKPDA